MMDSEQRPVIKSKLRVWTERAAQVFMGALATVSVLILVTLVWDAVLNPVAIQITDLDADKPEAVVCPGENLDLHLHINLKKPMLLYVYGAIMDEGQNYTLPGTQESQLPSPHPKPASFDITISRVVPDLPTGTWQTVIYFRGDVNSQKSAYFNKKFTRGACND